MPNSFDDIHERNPSDEATHILPVDDVANSEHESSPENGHPDAVHPQHLQVDTRFQDLTQDIDDDEETRRSRIAQKFEEFLLNQNQSSTADAPQTLEDDATDIIGHASNIVPDAVSEVDSENPRAPRHATTQESGKGRKSHKTSRKSDSPEKNRHMETVDRPEELYATNELPSNRQPASRTKPTPIDDIDAVIDAVPSPPRISPSHDHDDDEEILDLEVVLDPVIPPKGLNPRTSLDPDAFFQYVVLPFRVKVSKEDMARGLSPSKATPQQKDAVFPIPTKQHRPGVIDTRRFGYTEEKKDSNLLWIVLTLLLLATTIFLILYLLQ